MMCDVEKGIIVFNWFKELGVLLFIDDFGMGYLSLSYLKQFFLDVFKIDCLFIIEIFYFLELVLIVKVIVVLGYFLQLDIIVEGVEEFE